MADPVSLNRRSGSSIFTFYENRENLSSTIACRALEVAHRVPQTDLQAHIFYLNTQSRPKKMSKEQKKLPIYPYTLPPQGEKKQLLEPLHHISSIQPELYLKEFGDYLLQSTGYETTTLLEQTGKYLSNGEYAAFFNIETIPLCDPKLSVLIVKQDAGYGIAYFRDPQICKAYCNAKGLRSGQIRLATQSLTLSLFGTKKTETLELIQKPLVLSFQNPDCTSTCFLTFGEQNKITAEYHLGENNLQNRIKSVIETSGTYLHFTKDDLEILCPAEELEKFELSLMETLLNRSEIEHLL